MAIKEEKAEGEGEGERERIATTMKNELNRLSDKCLSLAESILLEEKGKIEERKEPNISYVHGQYTKPRHIKSCRFIINVSSMEGMSNYVV